MHQHKKQHHGRRLVLGEIGITFGFTLFLHRYRDAVSRFLLWAEDLFTEGAYAVERRSSYLSAQELFTRLQQLGLHPEIKTYGGDRTLLAIGEPPGNYQRKYPEFFHILGNMVDVDRLFMEFAYAQQSPLTRALKRERSEDPYFDRQIDVYEALTGTRMNYADAYNKLDAHGYASLASRYVINGLEDRVLCHDTTELVKLEQLLLLLDPESVCSEEFLALLSAVEQKISGRWRFTDGTSPIKPSYEDLVARVCDALLNAQISSRNQYFAQVINGKLEQYEVGAMIISDANFDPQHIIRRGQEKVPGLRFDSKKYGSLHDYLEAAKIDTVYLPFDDVKRMVG